MSTQIVVVLILNFIISLIGTLAYSVRLVGVRTGKIAISFALFNILMLVSRTAVCFQVPILTKYVESNSGSSAILNLFNVIIIVAGFATIFGAVLIPTFQRILYKGVVSFSIERSIPKLLIHSFSKSGIRYMKNCVAIPSKNNITGLNIRRLPIKVIFYNTLAVAMVTVGALAPIYAGIIEPRLRATCITLASVINGAALILMSIFIDPQMSIMTDDVIDGKCSEEDFRACVVGMVGSKAVGTFLALALLIPSAYLIAMIAKYMP